MVAERLDDAEVAAYLVCQLLEIYPLGRFSGSFPTWRYSAVRARSKL
jgi:hypothetical protein